MDFTSWQVPLGALLTGILSAIGAFIVTKVKAKLAQLAVSNPLLEQIQIKLNQYLDDAINTTNKKFVDKAKEEGLWDKSDGVFDNELYAYNAEKALNLCYDSLLSILPVSFKKLITKYFTDIKTFLITEIDRRLKERELEAKAAVAAAKNPEVI